MSARNVSRNLPKKYDLRYHVMVIHDKVKPWICTECPAVYKKEKLLYHHTRNMHSNMEYKCPHCDKVFNQSGNLKIHITTIHENNRPFPCSFCDQPFKTKSHLWQHQKVCPKKEETTNDMELPLPKVETEHQIKHQTNDMELPMDFSNAVHERLSHELPRKHFLDVE